MRPVSNCSLNFATAVPLLIAVGMPDVTYILSDSAVTREVSGPGDVIERHPAPALPVGIYLVEPCEGVGVGCEVLENEVWVVLFDEVVVDAPESIIAGVEGAVDEALGEPLEPRVFGGELP